MTDRHRASTRRHFLGQAARWSGTAAATLSLTPRLLARIQATSPVTLDPSRDENYWATIQQAFAVNRAIINLNNGGVSPSPRSTQEALWQHNQFANQTPAMNMWQVMEPQREAVRGQLAGLFGASPEEIAICRNTTEALDTVTFGLDLKPGDEIIATDQDYPRMVAAWNQRVRRDGVVFKQVTFATPPRRAADVVEAYAAAITPRTRLLHISHVVFLTGEILPVRELCQLARDRGLLSLVDGAHSFAHLPFRWQDLGCDFFGTSLHKWLSAPFGTGMLFVRRELIPRVWPLFGADESLREDIRKFEQIGTHPVALVLSIADAVRFHEAIGIERKAARLRYLRDHWTRRLEGVPGIRYHTNLGECSGALTTVEIEGIDTSKLYAYLKNEQIVTSPVRTERFEGVRVTPHLYTTLPELDRFVDRMETVARKGLPS